MNLTRVFKLNNMEIRDGSVIYWMSRDQRINDNWAMIYAQNLAKKLNRKLIVCFYLTDKFLGASQSQFSFMISNLKILDMDLKKLNIPFHLVKGDFGSDFIPYLVNSNAGLIVCDFDTLRIKRDWKNKVLKSINVALHEVDAHNIIPSRVASNKQEYGAYTIRPKIKKLLPEYLDEFEIIEYHKQNEPDDFKTNHFIINGLNFSNHSLDFKSSEKFAIKKMQDFIDNKLDKYNELRNDPSNDFQSNLSPYLHFGQISAQRIVLEIKKTGLESESINSYLEELIIRRELSDNYCFYNNNYDNFDGFPDWAKLTLDQHRKDKREYLYDLSQLENAQTHDIYWNAAQIEMVTNTKMHGYMRMYWAKKILEWTQTPEEALEYAIYLNDKYSLDGRDANGYTGIAWAIGGVHDRAWTERLVFGKIRYMNAAGLERKFRIKKYAAKFNK